MMKKQDLPFYLSEEDKKSAMDRRTKLYRLFNGIKPEAKKATKPPTEAQAKNMLRFGMATGFVKHLKQVGGICLNFRKLNITNANYLMRYILKYAVIGDYPDFAIDYPKVAFSDIYRIDPLSSRDISLTVNGAFSVNWEKGEHLHEGTSEKDVVFVLVYNAVEKLSYNFPATALRSDGCFTVNIPGFGERDDYHIWIFLHSPNFKSVSRVLYYNTIT